MRKETIERKNFYLSTPNHWRWFFPLPQMESSYPLDSSSLFIFEANLWLIFVPSPREGLKCENESRYWGDSYKLLISHHPWLSWIIGDDWLYLLSSKGTYGKCSYQEETWVGNSALLFVLGSFLTHWIPGLGRSPGGGHGNALQYSCQKNPMGRGAWWAPWSHKELDVPEATEYACSLSGTIYVSHAFHGCVLDDHWWWVTGRPAGRMTVTGSAS